ncbi:MAG: PDR/VanB family oxidoreductase [Polyangiales bacterium]
MIASSPKPRYATPSSRIWRFIDHGITRMLHEALREGTTQPAQLATASSLQLQISAVHFAAEGVRSVVLTDPAGLPLPAWQPGCHVELTLPSGRMRRYSLCGPPSDPHSYHIAVRHLPHGRGGSDELHTLAVGARLTVSLPRNAFPFIAAPRYGFVAGGIGITALLPMVRAAAERGAAWTLVYVGRSRTSLPFLHELEALATAQPERGQLYVQTDDMAGQPDASALLARLPPGAPLYVCGPGALLEALRRHVPSTSFPALHFERFTPAAVSGGAPFEIELARSGLRLPVAADETALAAVERQLPHVAHSCRQGFCGTCKVRVLAGNVEHHDSCLTAAERADAMTLCVSRAQSGRLVIDL